MGTTVLRYIPEEPTYVPGSGHIEAARSLLERSLGVSVVASITPVLAFVDPGDNLDTIRCPACGEELDMGFWQERMSTAGETGFAKLELTMPCCGAETSLHDLDYDAAAGFARLVLEVHDPQADADQAVDQDALERALGCLVRRIDASY